MSSRQVKDIRLLSQATFFSPSKPLAAVLSQRGTFYTHRTQRRGLHVAKMEIPQSLTRLVCGLYAMELCSSSRQGVAFTSAPWESTLACGRFCWTEMREKCSCSSSGPRFHDALCLEILMNYPVNKPGLHCWIWYTPSQLRPAWATHPHLTGR